MYIYIYIYIANPHRSLSPSLYRSSSAKLQEATGPPLPPGWVRVPHERDHYYWNTQTNEAGKIRKNHVIPRFPSDFSWFWVLFGWFERLSPSSNRCFCWLPTAQQIYYTIGSFIVKKCLLKAHALWADSQQVSWEHPVQHSGSSAMSTWRRLAWLRRNRPKSPRGKRNPSSPRSTRQMDLHNGGNMINRWIWGYPKPNRCWHMLTQISFQSAHHSSRKVLWTDIGKIIGRQGMNLKIIKAWVQLGWSVVPWERKAAGNPDVVVVTMMVWQRNNLLDKADAEIQKSSLG